MERELLPPWYLGGLAIVVVTTGGVPCTFMTYNNDSHDHEHVVLHGAQ
jgi:hypothetical protein